MPSNPYRSVLIIGASEGLGLAIATRYAEAGAQVLATALDQHDALDDLRSRFGDSVTVEHVDITIPAELTDLRERLGSRSLDLLFNVAGVTNQEHPEGPTPLEVETEEFVRLMVTNALGPIRAIETFEDLVTPDGTIAIMSSGQASIADNEQGGFEIYRSSKSALNQLMRSYVARHADDGRTFLLMAPGWVKTKLGGPDARLTIEESIPSLVDVVDAQAGKPGLQFLDYQGKTVSW